LGQWFVSRVAAYDTVGFKMFLPTFQIVPTGYGEARVVEPGRRFRKEAAVVGVVSVQSKHELPVGVGEDFSDAALVRYIEYGMDVEDRRVPPDAGVQVGDGQGQMV
jgi:hypothetical protein